MLLDCNNMGSANRFIISLISISCLSYSLCQANNDIFHCKPKSECKNGDCKNEPVRLEDPSFDIESYLHMKEFPITCVPEKKIIKSLETRIAELQNELNSIKQEMKQFNSGMKFALALIGEKLKSFSQPGRSAVVKDPGKLISGCGSPPEIPYGDAKCTDGSFTPGTNCSISCIKNHILKGESNIACLDNSQWSDDFPTCVCQECETGEYCEQTISWNQFIAGIKQKEMCHLVFLAYYDNHQINCTSWDSWNDRNCACQDMETRHNVTCVGYSERYIACEHSSAELIRQMVKRKAYKTPCDLHEMTTGC